MLASCSRWAKISQTKAKQMMAFVFFCFLSSERKRKALLTCGPNPSTDFWPMNNSRAQLMRSLISPSSFFTAVTTNPIHHHHCTGGPTSDGLGFARRRSIHPRRLPPPRRRGKQLLHLLHLILFSIAARARARVCSLRGAGFAAPIRAVIVQPVLVWYSRTMVSSNQLAPG